MIINKYTKNMRQRRYFKKFKKIIYINKNCRYNFLMKKQKLFLYRKLIYFQETDFEKSVIIRLKSNNIFFTYNDILSKRTIFSCVASRYRLKITKKTLKHQIIRLLTFAFHEIKEEIGTEGIVIKIISPKYLKSKIFYWCSHYFGRFKVEKEMFNRFLFFNIPDKKIFNGCRVRAKRRKRKKRRIHYKKTA